MADAVPELTPYTTVMPLAPTPPTWMSELDGQRTVAYQIYEQMYKNVQGTFALTQRGTDALPIYVPEPRVIVDTMYRYTAPKPSFVVDPEFGTPEQQAAAQLAFRDLFNRERWVSKFSSNKRFGLIRGDWAFHIVADATKLPGRRLSIYTLDPASLFQIDHPDDLDRIMGYHIIDQVQDVAANKTYIKRLTYSKGPDPYDPDLDDGKIWSQMGLFEIDGWDTEDAKQVSVIMPPAPLPDAITALPVYLIRNREEPGQPWGVSELAGSERLFSALNQAVSDEELALALEGLGLYATTSGPPEVDGKATNWRLGPGKVVELPDIDGKSVKDIFDRVSGVGSVQPYQNHIDMLIKFLRSGSGIPDAAVGKVDVQIAESGVALALEMAPILASAEDKDQTITDVLVQMFYDLKAWFSAYESLTLAPEIIVTPMYGSKLPVNVDAEVTRILTIVQAKVASTDWARVELAKFGYTFDAAEGDKVTGETAATAAAADPYAQRTDSELGATDEESAA